MERQQLLLQRAGALPILEADEPGAGVGELVALVVAEDDRPRRDLGRRDGGHRGDLLQRGTPAPKRRPAEASARTARKARDGSHLSRSGCARDNRGRPAASAAGAGPRRPTTAASSAGASPAAAAACRDRRATTAPARRRRGPGARRPRRRRCRRRAVAVARVARGIGLLGRHEAVLGLVEAALRVEAEMLDEGGAAAVGQAVAAAQVDRQVDELAACRRRGRRQRDLRHARGPGRLQDRLEDRDRDLGRRSGRGPRVRRLPSALS